MFSHLRTSGLIVIGTSLSILMFGLAALIALPLLVGSAALSLTLAAPVRHRLDRMRAEALGGAVIEGQWTVVNLGDPAKRRTTE